MFTQRNEDTEGVDGVSWHVAAKKKNARCSVFDTKSKDTVTVALSKSETLLLLCVQVPLDPHTKKTVKLIKGSKNNPKCEATLVAKHFLLTLY